MEKVIFATNNEHKLYEVKKMLSGLYEVIGLVPAAPAVNLTESDPEEGVIVIPVGTLGALGVGGGGATIGPPTGSRYNK